MSSAGGNGGGAASLAVLRSMKARKPPDPTVQRCDMCAEQINDEHQHVVDLHSRALMCTCRACYLLFVSTDAQIRYRAVPERYLSFPTLSLQASQWDTLQIPVGLAFFFFSSVLDRTVALYPGPAGVTESELALDPWDAVTEANPQLKQAAPDVEALLVQAPGPDHAEFRCYLVPIDSCYELAGRMRMVWRGFDGGSDARQVIADFFADVARRSKPAKDLAASEVRDG